MKKLLFLMVAIMQLSFASAATNSDYFVRGHVIDASTGEHVPHATAAIKGSTIGAVADQTGHFYLGGIPNGEHTLIISMMGYSPIEKMIKVAGKGEYMDETFNLTPDVMSLDQVVITASRSEVTRSTSPSVVSVLPMRMFEEVSAPTLLDGLDYVPGVRVEANCQNCGFTSVRINGLDGHYTQVLVDSRPMFSALTNVYGLEQIPTNMIDRVEVIRGGASAIYGSSAIGGTINVITKMPEYNSAEISNTLNIIEKGSLDNNTTANISMISDNLRSGATIFGQIRNRGAYDADGDGFSEIAELQSQTLGIRTFFKTSDYTKLSVGYDFSSEYRRGGDNLDLVAHDPRVDIAEMLDHNINGGSLSFDIFSKDYSRKINIYSSAQYTDRDSYYGGGGEDVYGETNELISVTGVQASQNWGQNMTLPSEFIVGVEHSYNDLKDWLVNGSSDPTEQSYNNYAFYVQNEWSNDKLGLLLGVRGDRTTLLDKMKFSPRVNLRYNPTESVNFRASYTTGFRAPQIFDEDLHIGMVGGEERRVTNSEDLETENSQSVNLSADLYKDFGKWSTNLLIEGFYTNIDNSFVINETTYERENSTGSQATRGVTAEARAVLPNVVTLQGSITYQKSTYSEDQVVFDNTNDDLEDGIEISSNRVLRSPSTYGYVTANFDLTRKLALSLSGTYTGSMLISHAQGWADVNSLYETPDFFDGNIKVSYTFPIVQAGRLELSAGVLNVFNSYQSDFDQGPDRDAGYVYGPLNPRRYSVAAKLMF